jgi:hypothetical protein
MYETIYMCVHVFAFHNFYPQFIPAIYLPLIDTAYSFKPFFFPAYIFPTHSRLRIPANSLPVIFPAHAFPPFLSSPSYKNTNF